MSQTTLSDVADVQLSGLTGRKSKHNRHLAIISQIPAAREVEKNRQVVEQQKKQLAAQTALQNESASIAKTQANRATAIQGTTTLGQAAYLTKDAWLPAVKSGLGLTESVANPALSSAATEAALNAAPVEAFANAAPAVGELSTVAPATLPEAAATVANAAESATAATGATGSSLGSTVASVAGPVAIVGAAELVKKAAGGKGMEWGNKNNDWDEKTVFQQMTSAPGTAGGVVPFVPGAIFDQNGIGGKFIKEMANAERLVMKPIDWLLGDK